MNEGSAVKLKVPLTSKIALIIFGIFLSFIILEIGLRIGGFVVLSLQDYRNRQTLRQKGSYRILCLGESTTQEAYPAVLEKILNQKNIGVTFSVIDKGLDGITTSTILARLPSYIDKYHPDMVVTMMGINDATMMGTSDDCKTHSPYETAAHSKGMLFFRSLRTYKLGRLLWLHMLAKSREKGFFRPHNNENPCGGMQVTEASLKKAIASDPENWDAYSKLVKCYMASGNFSQAEGIFRKIIERYPAHYQTYLELGEFYGYHGKFFPAEHAFQEAIRIQPENYRAYVQLGVLYKARGNFFQAEDMFKKAIALNCKDYDVYFQIGKFYENRGKFSQAEDMFRKAAEVGPVKKTNTSLPDYSSSVTVSNYRTLKNILAERKIRYVCMQYPMCNIESLKKIFGDHEEQIIFVDNEKIFRDAVAKSGYSAYFKDMFGVEFGHCTEKGNSLLAQNLANVIMKEVFGRF